jgi:hypothetical protein
MKSDDNELAFSKFEELVQFWFEKDTNVTKSEFNTDWIDPYDSIWLKLLSFIFYVAEIFESLIMITFVNYETAGYFGHYRTLINQLLSHLYGGVSIFLRVWKPCTLLGPVQMHPVQRDAFCQFPFRWIYYCHSSKSTGKETGKMHLCAVPCTSFM